MKKSAFWKMLFGMLTTVVLAAFVGCVDDNDDMGAPYLEVKPQTLAFDMDGAAADEFGGIFVVETNRPWRAEVEEGADWVRLGASKGDGATTVEVAVPQANKGRSAKVTFEVYNSYGPLLTQTVTVTQGEVVPPTLIFKETMGSESVASPYPLVSAYTGWVTTGEGAGEVAYEGSNTSIRSSGKSNAGAYPDASGPNGIFFGAAPATFTVKNIALKENQTDLQLTFGGSYYNQDANDNIFKTDEFEVSLSADGVSFVKLPYTINDGDKVDPYWVYATANFTLKEAVPTLYIRFATKTDSSHFRMDDPTLMTGNGGQVIDLKGGGDNPDPGPGPDPVGDAVYSNDFDKAEVAKGSDNKWPFLDQSDLWLNATGSGIATVEYEYTQTSVRSSSMRSGGYDGASGVNKIFFGSNASFSIKNITLPAGKNSFRIVFGAAHSKNNGGTYDNLFKPESFHVWVGNGTDWKELTYEQIGGSDEKTPWWVQLAADFTLKETLSELSIRFTADIASVFSIDDLQLLEGEGGQEIVFDGGTVEPGEAVAITIPELNAKMTEPMTSAVVLDPDKDYWFEAVVMNDVAGGNYTFNNLILATENATEAGNGITCYGSQVEPSKLNLTRGDKVRVTLLKGLAKYQNYNGMYQLTGDKDATWCTIEKLDGQAAVKETVIAPADLAKYQGMAVTIENASVAQAGVWASSSALSKHTFTAGGTSFTVFCKKVGTDPMVFADVPFKAATGSISGLAAVNSNAGQLVPRNLDDVAAFDAGGETPAVPAILSVDPATLSFAAEGGVKTVTVVVENKGDNLLSVSGLTAPLSATVDNDANTVTVTAAANSGAAVSQTLTIALAGGNSKTVAITQEGQGGGEEPGGDTKGIYSWMKDMLPTEDDSKTDYYYGSSTVAVKVGETTSPAEKFLRLGKSKFAGAYTTPALGVTGDKKLSFYAVGWNNAPTKVYVRVNGGGSVTGSPVDVPANAGYSGSSNAFTMELTDANYFTFELTGLTAESTVTISTSEEFKGASDSANKSRAGIIGLQVY